MTQAAEMAAFGASEIACYDWPEDTQHDKDCRAAFIKGAAWSADEIERLRADLIEIANRASNMMDDDAAEWMPSIYKIACEAAGEDPWRLLKAAGFTPETMSVTAQQSVKE